MGHLYKKDGYRRVHDVFCDDIVTAKNNQGSHSSAS